MAQAPTNHRKVCHPGTIVLSTVLQKYFGASAHTKLVSLCRVFFVLLLYVSYLYRQGLSYNTIQVYLYSIRSLHIFHGYNNPLQHCLRLNQIVKAVHISSGVAKQKLPITVELLRKLQPIVSTFNDGSMLWTAMLLAFFGCLRASEFTVNTPPSESFRTNLCRLCVWLN